jgi:hypothetical protein
MDQDIVSLRNYGIALGQIRDLWRLPPQACPADIVAKVRELKAAADMVPKATPTSMLHVCYVFNQIRILLALDEDTLPEQILAKVRETKVAAELAGEALMIERDSSMSITPETFAAWQSSEPDTELMLLSDGSGALYAEDGLELLSFGSPAEFAARFDR